MVFAALVDHWDLDHPFERLLVDTVVTPDPASVKWINPRLRPGEVRKVVTGVPGKTGLVYTLDRETGQFFWARETIEQNVIAASEHRVRGRRRQSRQVLYTGVGQQHLVCPSLHGGKNYHAGTYSPLTGAMYVPAAEHLYDVGHVELRSAGSPDDVYAIDTRGQLPPGAENVGTIEAISVATGHAVET